MTVEAGLIRDGSLGTDLVARARNGDEQAWNTLVERYAPLVWSVCRRHQLAGNDAYTVAYRVWLKLMDQEPARLDLSALSGWLPATTQQECGRLRRASPKTSAAIDAQGTESSSGQQDRVAEHEVLIAQRHAALREAFAHLSPPCQQLISLLVADPPLTRAEISARLGIPIACIESRLSHCLETLRRDIAS